MVPSKFPQVSEGQKSNSEKCKDSCVLGTEKQIEVILIKKRNYITHKLLKADLMVRLCPMQQAYDWPTTRIVLGKSNLQLAYDCGVRHKKCRRILKSYDNRRYRQCRMTRVVCGFWHYTSSAHSRNCMRQS